MNRAVLITGSTRGIGLSTAARFLERGDRVVVMCRHEAHVNETIKWLGQKFQRLEYVLGTVGDVREPGDAQRIVNEVKTKFGTIDVLVNNAGIGVWKLVEETSVADWNDVINTNLSGCFYFTHEVVPPMKQQGSGVIINISSGLGARGDAKYSAYSASKFGVIGLTQSVAIETHEFGLKVYAILPGAVDTKLHRDMHPLEETAKTMTPEYVAEKIFTLSEGKKPSGTALEVYK